jgi:hypothetical protein
MFCAAALTASVIPVVAAIGPSVGASFVAFTVTDAVSVALEKAELPPLLVVSTFVPAVPVLSSQARNVMPSLTVPLKLAAGWKYSRVLALASSSSALAPLT